MPHNISVPMEVPGKIRIKRNIEYSKGEDISVTMTAKNFTEALKQEVVYCWGRDKSPAIINLSIEED